MPYKRYKRTYKKRSYRKRAYRKKRYIKKKSLYGKYLSWKCEVSQVALTQEVDSSTADCTINWLTINNPLTTGVYVKPNDSGEFTLFANQFRYYRIIGVRIRYQPIGSITSVGSSYVRSGQFASFEGETGINNFTSDASMRGALDYLQFDATKVFNRYIRVWKHQKATYGTKWTRTGEYPGTEACSLFRVHTNGYSDEGVVGTITVTYYCQFRQLRT